MSNLLFQLPTPRPVTRQSRRAIFEYPEWGSLAIGSVLLAIDPSIANCGFCTMVKTSGDPIRLNSGIIHPRGNSEMTRFDDLARQIKTLAEHTTIYNGETYKPTDAVVEVPSGGQRGDRSATQLMVYARAIGICEATCYLAGLSLNRVPVVVWKGNQRKERTLMVVKALMKYMPRDDNECDAIGLGLWLCAQQ